MSHIVKNEAKNAWEAIRSLDALRAASENCCGLLFKEGQTQYRTWASDHGRLYGDAPLPKGMKANDVGACMHAIGLQDKDKTRSAASQYEIGLIPSEKHEGAFALVYDNWQGALEAKAGKDLSKLMAHYQAEHAKIIAQGLGDSVLSEQELDDGSILLEIDTTNRMGE
jgi:hypothetical protein